MYLTNDTLSEMTLGNEGLRSLLEFAGFKSSKSLKKLQKSLLFIDDKLRDTTMIVGHLKKQSLRDKL